MVSGGNNNPGYCHPRKRFASAPTLLWPLLALVAMPAAATAAGGASSSSKRPPFLEHVSVESLRQAMEVSKRRHDAAVRQALDNYPVDTAVTETVDPNFIDNIRLTPHKLTTVHPNSLPDFNDELGRTVYVTYPPLFDRAECEEVVQMAEQHFRETNDGEWTKQTSGQYEVSGFLLKDAPAVKEWFIKTCRTKLFPLLAKTYPEFCNADDLCVDNSYLFKYTPETGRRTNIHTDSGCLSFTIALNGRDEYGGGGTWFQGLEENGGDGVLEMDAGQVTFRPGGVMHCGKAVTSGTRYIIGGFCMHRRKPEHVRMLLTDPNDQASVEAAIVLNPSFSSSYSILGSLFEKCGELDKAQQVLEYCLEHVTTRAAEVSYALGVLLIDQGLFRKAGECLQNCLSIDPEDADALMAAAKVAAAAGDEETERAHYRAIIDTPDADPRTQAKAYCNLGALLNKDDDGELQIEYYRKSLELSPDYFAAGYNLGGALASRGRHDEALEVLRETIDRAKANGETRIDMAVQTLYRVVSLKVQSSPDAATWSREQVLDAFREHMGADNFARVQATSGQG